MLKEVGISPEKAREMTVPRIADAIGIKMNFLPKPSATHCIILNDERVKIMDVVVKRYYNEAYDVDKARWYSMQKAIDVLFPKKEIDKEADPESEFVKKLKQENKKNKEARGAFWNAYRNRNKKNKENANENRASQTNKETNSVPQAVQAD
jgi:hypothetical protein